MLEIVIPGNPVPWAAHQGYGRKSFNPRFKEREYVQWHIKKQFKGNYYCKGPLRVDYEFLLPIPKSLTKSYKKCTDAGERLYSITRPDLTNYVKFAEDCLKGIVFDDDSIVCLGWAAKRYDEEPRTIIRIFEIEGQDMPLKTKAEKAAVKHKDVLGAGAKKRKGLKGQEKVHIVMDEFKHGKLHSGSGQKVKSKDQAIAIAMKEIGKSKKKK